MMNRSTIKKLNLIAEENFERAQAMLDGINLLLGTEYGWLGGRVVVFDNPYGTVAEKYAGAHDAWFCAPE